MLNNKCFYNLLFLILILFNYNSHAITIIESKEIFNKDQTLSKKNFAKQQNYVTIDNQNIYLINKLGIIYKYNLANNNREVIFKCNHSKNSYKTYSIYYQANHLFIVLDGKLVVLNLESKKIIWEYKSDYNLANSIIFDQNSLFLITKHGQIQVRNIYDGNLKWFFQNNLGGLKNKNYPRIFLRNNQLIAFYTNGQIIIFDKNSGLNNAGLVKPIEFSKALELIRYEAIGKDLHNNHLLINSNQRTFILDIDEYKISKKIGCNGFKNAFYDFNMIYALSMQGKLFVIKSDPLEYSVHNTICKFNYNDSNSKKNRSFDKSNIFQYQDKLFINCKKNILIEFNKSNNSITQSKIKSHNMITLNDNYIISWFNKSIYINKIST